jgi:son of sevenless-like protein
VSEIEIFFDNDFNASIDQNYSKAFLMTFKSFTTLDELFDLLVERFRIQPPQGLSGLELKQWINKKRNLVQFR